MSGLLSVWGGGVVVRPADVGVFCGQRERVLRRTAHHCQLHYTLSNVEFTHHPLHLGARDPEDEGEFGVVDRDEPA